MIVTLREKLWTEKDPILKSILSCGFIKLIYNNPQIFQLIKIQEIELLSSLLLIWKDQNLKNNNTMNLNTL